MLLCISVENIVEAALCKSVLKPLREPIYHRLEKLHTDDGSLKQLTDNQVGKDNWNTFPYHERTLQQSSPYVSSY